MPWFPHPRRTAFTLVELLIAVAIVGLLAALAIPNFYTAVLKSRRAEAKANLDGIATAELAYHAAHDAYVACANNPGSSLTKVARPFNPALAGWSALDYIPSGDVRCNYIVELFGTPQYFRASANCDVDDNNQTATIRRYGPEYPGATWNDLYPLRY
jgi:prepilin-type N-terminal cleavage/methylation domain-containing protein